jgi:hypothetical protein
VHEFEAFGTGFCLLLEPRFDATRVYKDLDMTKHHPIGNSPKEIQRN